ncbi:hypothetical protein C8J28_11735 [Cereibacter azotoformans]|uniref:Uncharacterized protein n=1 Tax=Cereibacter azotoformans TaxID=43057 RepID=A0A2T5JVU4_9RHOB|nr:hypothetical protein C8J28_11735 [Cereibacter azotoformans]
MNACRLPFHSASGARKPLRDRAETPAPRRARFGTRRHRAVTSILPDIA